MPTIIHGASPYNNRIELTARGWHAPCVVASWASLCMHGSRQFPPAPSLPGRRLRPCSQLIRALRTMGTMKSGFIILALAMSVQGKMPPNYALSLKSAYLYFLDWNEKGYHDSTKKHLTKRPPQKIYLTGAPKELSYRETSFLDSGPRVKEFQLAILFIYEKGPKERIMDYLFVDKNCSAVELRGRTVDPKIWVPAIYKSVPEKVRDRIFLARSCKEVIGPINEKAQGQGK